MSRPSLFSLSKTGSRPLIPCVLNAPPSSETSVRCRSPHDVSLSPMRFSMPGPLPARLRLFARRRDIRRFISAVIALCAHRVDLALTDFWRGQELRLRLAEWLRVELVPLGGQAAPGFQIELPAMHGAGQHAVFDR